VFASPKYQQACTFPGFHFRRPQEVLLISYSGYNKTES
jgi:hypothetical protein